MVPLYIHGAHLLSLWAYGAKIMTQAGGGGRQPTAGSSGRRVEGVLVEQGTGKAGKVYISGAAYEQLTQDSSLVAYDFQNFFPAPVVIGTYQVGVLAATEYEVVDISELSLSIVSPLGGGGTYDVAPDYTYFADLRWQVTVNSSQPWDQYTIVDAGLGVTRLPGWAYLNQNVMASWSGIEAHLFILPRQVFAVQCLVATAGIFPVSTRAICRMRGRRIAYAKWKAVVDRNALPGGL